MADIENKKDTTTPTKEESKSVKPKKTKAPLKERIGNFFRTYKSEFKKIVWSSPKSVLNNTVLVLVSCIALSACIGLLDFVFSNLIVALGRLI